MSALQRTAARPSMARPAVLYVVMGTIIAAWFPYIALFYESIGLSLEAIGLLAALNFAVGMVAAPMWGVVADRLGSVRMPLAVAGVWGAAAAGALGTARDPYVVAACVPLLSVAFSAIGPLLDARTIQIAGSDRDRYGQARAWGSISFILGALAVGALLDTTGPEGLFLVLVPALAIAGATAFVLLGNATGSGRTPAGPAAQTGPRHTMRSLSHPTLRLFFVGSVLLWTSATAVYTFFSVHLIALGANSLLVGIGWAVPAAVEVPLMVAFPALARRFGGERLLVVAAVAFAVRAAAWSLAGEPFMLLAFAPLSGVGFALFYVGSVTYVARAVPPEIQATAQGFFSGTAFSLGSILGGTLGGLLVGALTIRGLFVVCAITTALAAVFIWWAIVPARRRVGLGVAMEVATDEPGATR